MMLVAWIFPPLALLMIGRPFSAILNFMIWCFGFVTIGGGFLVALIHSCYAVHEHNRNKAMQKFFVRAMNGDREKSVAEKAGYWYARIAR